MVQFGFLSAYDLKLKQNSFKTVLFQPKQNAPAVKHFTCFSQSQSLSAAWCMGGKPTAGVGA